MEKARLIVLAGCLLLAACRGGVHTATYATVEEAQASGGVRNGWVPAIVPAGAYELRAAYDVAGPRRWGLFNFRPADAGALRAILRPEEVSIAGTMIDIPNRIEWWPIILRGRLDEERIRITGLRAHQSTDGTLTFLVNWNQGRAYYWNSAR